MRNAHILIAHDHSSIAPYVQKTLETEGFLVTVCAGAQNAIAKLQEDHWALIIVDGGFSAPETKQLVARTQEKRSMPILAISPFPEKATDDEMRALGIKHYISKPFAFQELIATARHIIESGHASGSEIVLDTLTIDTKEHAVERDGKPITLTRKEYALLAHLAKHRNQAVSRGDLLEHVWGMQIDPLSNTIEAHILSLRRKVDFPGQTKLIHTVPKFGYRLSVNK